MKWKHSLSDIVMSSEERDAVLSVLMSKWLSCGPVTERFEAEAAGYLGVSDAVAVSSGTASLHLALQSLGVGPGDEVIVPSLTFVATANAVLYAGATPVFAEVTSPADLTISPDDLLDKITPRTRGIIVMHYGGYPCDMGSVLEVAMAHELFVVEDAAHAIGSRIDGEMLGTLGDVGCYSFFANKNLAAGEGGLLVAKDPDVTARVRRLRSHAMSTVTWDREQGHAFSYDVTELGYNYRITEMQSALARVQLSRLEGSNSRRRDIVARYRRNLSEARHIAIPFAGVDGDLACHLFAVVLDAEVDRRGFMTELKRQGIQSSIHYPPVHLFSYYRGRGYEEGSLPRTEAIAARLVTLPLHPLLQDDDVDEICDAALEAECHEVGYTHAEL